MGRAKGTICKSSIVVDIMQLRKDWEAKSPSYEERDFDCRIRGFHYSAFKTRAVPSKLINGCGIVKIDTYFKWIEASGLDINKYECKGADPHDYIKKAPEVSESESSENTDESAVATTEPSEVKQPDIVIFEKPKKQTSSPKNTSTASSKRAPSSNIPLGITIGRAPSVELPEYIPPKASKTGYVRTIKKADTSERPVRNNSANVKLNKFNLKMKGFLTHLPVYLCALHLSADDVIYSTSITNFRDIRDGKIALDLYEYIVLSEYLMRVASTTSDSDAKEMFDQVAKCFNDIYISTLYYNHLSENS